MRSRWNTVCHAPSDLTPAYPPIDRDLARRVSSISEDTAEAEKKLKFRTPHDSLSDLELQLTICNRRDVRRSETGDRVALRWSGWGDRQRTE